MSNREDRYHTTSWDGRQVQRQQQSAAGGQAPRSQQSRSASGGQGGSKKKAKKSRINPLLGILLWVVIVVASSAIFAGVGWMLANDLCAFNKTPLETTVVISEEWITEKEVKQDDGTVEIETTADMGKVADALEEQGLIEYKWFFRLFSVFYKSSERIQFTLYRFQ